MVDPLVLFVQTIWLVSDVFDIRAETVEKFAFKKLQDKDKKSLLMASYYVFQKEK